MNAFHVSLAVFLGFCALWLVCWLIGNIEATPSWAKRYDALIFAYLLGIALTASTAVYGILEVIYWR